MGSRKPHFKAPSKKIFPPEDSLVGQEARLEITQLAGLGEGAGEFSSRKIFIPCTTAGDSVRAVIIKDNPQFLRGELLEVISPSKDRTEAPCKWFERCGGCTLQHLNKDSYQRFKTGMLTEAVRKAGYDISVCDAVHFLGSASRRRVEFKVQSIAGKAEIGFYKLNSHTLIPVDHCLMLSPRLDECFQKLRNWIQQADVSDAIHAIRISEVESQLDMTVEMKQAGGVKLSSFESLLQAIGIRRLTVMSKEGKRIGAIGNDVVKRMGKSAVPIPEDIFLQASEEGEKWLVEKVCGALAGSKRIADLFCGIGTYAFPLSEGAEVMAYEIDEKMILVMKGSTVKGYVRNLFLSPLKAAEINAYDAMVVNPPRDGAKAQCEQIAASSIRKVVMVSCNPATFTRDAGILNKAGFKLTLASGLDQFVFSPYLEIVAVFEK